MILKQCAVAIIISGLSLLSGCGGGGGGGSTPAPSALKGIWAGTSGANSASAVVLSNGDAWVVFNESGVTNRFARLQIQTSGTSYTSTGTQYLLQTGLHESASATGTYSEKFAISGSVTTTSGTANYSLAYDPRSGIPSNLSDAVGSWTGSFGGGSSVRTIIIGATGSLAGTSTTGCTYSGSLTPLTTDPAVFDVTFTESCVVGTPTLLSGIATLNTAKTGLSFAVTTADKNIGALFVGTKLP